MAGESSNLPGNGKVISSDGPLILQSKDGSVSLLVDVDGTAKGLSISASTGDITFIGGTAIDVTIGDEIVMTGTTNKIRANTADAADNAVLELSGGGEVGSSGTRGGWIRIFGNENAGVGSVQVAAGAVNSSSTVDLLTYASASIRMRPATLNTWSFAAGGTLTQDATNGGDIVLNKDSSEIRMGTSDGADNKFFKIAGGGAFGSSRGGGVAVYGNEASGFPGTVQLSAGLITNGTIRFDVGGSNRFNIDQSGNFNQDGTNGGNIVMTKAGTYVAQPVQTIAATGTNLATAALITGVNINVTGADGTVGVALPTPVAGRMVFLYNANAAILKVYAPTGTTVNALTVVSIPASNFAVFYALSATVWRAGTMANAS